MSYELSILLSFFIAYALVGWVHEVLFRLVTERRFYTTGFLTTPILPIYGIGAIGILLLVAPYVTNPFVVFILGVLISTVLEYVGHFLIDKIFHIKLWDYSDKQFNVHGRVCLQNSLGFGALTLLLVYVLHPLIGTGILKVPEQALVVIASILAVIISIDFINSVLSLLRVRMQKISGTLRDVQEHVLSEIKRINSLNQRRSFKGVSRKVLLKVHKVNMRRIASAYPRARRR